MDRVTMVGRLYELEYSDRLDTFDTSAERDTKQEELARQGISSQAFTWKLRRVANGFVAGRKGK